MPKETVNKIVTKIIVTRIESATDKMKVIHDKLKGFGYFKNAQDKVMIIKIVAGQKEINYIISQREKYAYDVENLELKFYMDNIRSAVKKAVPMGKALDEFTRHNRKLNVV